MQKHWSKLCSLFKSGKNFLSYQGLRLVSLALLFMMSTGYAMADAGSSAITGEVEKYQPVKVTRESIPLAKESSNETSQDDGLTQMCGGYTIDELHNALRQEHDNPGSTPLKDVMKLYE